MSRRAPFSSLVLGLLAGCTVGPDRDPRPPLALPPAFAASPDVTSPGRAWWRTFADPVLTDLVRQALAANHDIAAAAARVSEARALAGAAEAAGLPAVDAAADRQWLYSSREGAGLDGAGVRAGLVGRSQDVHRLGVAASWEVDLFGAVARRSEAAAAAAEIRAAELRGVELVVATQVARNYLLLRLAAQRQAIAAARVQRLQREVELARALAAAGLAAADAVPAATAALAAEAPLPALYAADAAANERALAVLVAAVPTAFAVPAATVALDVPAPDGIGLGVPAELLRRRPDLVAAEAAVAAASAAVGIATADLYPRLFLLGGAGVESRSLDRLLRGDALQALGGPSLQLPLFRGGALRQALAAAEAGHRAALASFAQRVLAALAEVEDAATRHAAVHARWRDAERGAADAARLAAAAEQRHAAGLTDGATVLQAERRRLAAEEQAAVARCDAALAAVGTFAALGGGFGP